MLGRRKQKTKNTEVKKPKRPYTTPRLIEYGGVAKLTAGTGTIVSDAGAGMRFRRCI